MAKLPSAEAWVAATIGELRKPQVDSWAGRIHVHKVLFLVDVLDLADQPFEFELHQFGPYSFDLDRQIAMMEAIGRIEVEYFRAGYGPRHNVSEMGRPIADRLSDPDRAAIARVVGVVGKRGSKELELIATCIWVMKREAVSGDDKVIAAVRRIKPRYSTDEVAQALGEAKVLEAKLKSEA